MKLNLLSHVKIHDVINIMHTVPFLDQSDTISAPVTKKPDLVPVHGDVEFTVGRILRHRRRGRRYQFLTLMKCDPTPDAKGQAMRDFVGQDGTMNEQFLKYIQENNILHHLYEEKAKVVWVDKKREAGKGERSVLFSNLQD